MGSSQLGTAEAFALQATSSESSPMDRCYASSSALTRHQPMSIPETIFPGIIKLEPADLEENLSLADYSAQAKVSDRFTQSIY